jgi:hypothetical protein
MAKKIQPVSVWVGGEVKTAEWMNMRSINDDLETTATFYYELLENGKDEDQNDIPSTSLVGGNLTMAGQDYQDWGNQSGTDINTWAYDWAAGQLNLVII